ncbi:hypothetical protein LIER_37101 [Lithospermum erythrorhizon]|uniref:Uncharacterized protein n=1 Tax=Lithospermum erythrorhizon TaxID=34254 RepID=A0AAV3PG94_LITER
MWHNNALNSDMHFFEHLTLKKHWVIWGWILLLLRLGRTLQKHWSFGDVDGHSPMISLYSTFFSKQTGP